MALADRHVAAQPRGDHALADHVQGVEGVLIGHGPSGTDGADRFAVGASRRDARRLHLGIAQGGQLAAEDAAGIDVHRPVVPLGLGNGGVAEHHPRRALVVRRPVEAHRQAELVALAGRLAVEGEVAHLRRAAPLHLLLEPGVGHHQPAPVEDGMAHQAIEERDGLLDQPFAAIRRHRLDLGQGLGQAVRDADLLAAQLAEQLHVVVARHAQGRPGGAHRPHDPQRVQHARPAVHQVAHEHRLPPLRMPPLDVAEQAQQRLQLVGAAVDIADDVERPAVVALVAPQAHALEGGGVDGVGAFEAVDVGEALALQAAQRAAQLGALLPHDVRAEIAPGVVPLLAGLLGHVQHDGHGQGVEAPGQLDERLAGLGLHIGGVDDREFAASQPLGSDEMQRLESVPGRALVGLVVADHGAEGVGRKHLRRGEVLAREGRFARARCPHQHDQAQLGDGKGHPASRVKTAICVGWPNGSCPGPMPLIATA